jgi:ABC-2 type transport system ATP-binding protein
LNILEIHQLNKAYGNTTALSNINLNIPKNGIFGLLGPNGAGKTSLIRIINQIIDADSGSIFFNGELLNPKHISRIGYLPEERGLYKKMKVWDQLLYFAQLKGMSSVTAKQKVHFWLDKMEILTWKDKRIDDLSKGMAQKIQFISTVIHEPELLILDEPFSGFDPVNAETIKNEILGLKAKGITVVLSTHRMESVELLCDEIAMIHKSHKILEGSLTSVKHQFRSNSYQIRLKPNNKPLPFEWISTDHEGIISFQLPLGERSPNHLLQQIMDYGEVIAFNEILPTMEEIFIRQIKNYQNG